MAPRCWRVEGDRYLRERLTIRDGVEVLLVSVCDAPVAIGAPQRRKRAPTARTRRAVSRASTFAAALLVVGVVGVVVACAMPLDDVALLAGVASAARGVVTLMVQDARSTR